MKTFNILPIATEHSLGRLAMYFLLAVLLLALLGILSPAHGQPWNKVVIDSTLFGPNQLFVADIDGDNDLDVAATAYFGDDVVWYENDSLTWNKHVITNNLDGPGGVYVADINGDNIMDVFAGGHLGVVWYEGPTWTRHNIDVSGGGTVYFSVADMDGDTDLDVVVPWYTKENIVWYEAPNWTQHLIDSQLKDPLYSAVADLDGDNDLDVIVTDSEDFLEGKTGAGSIFWYEAPDWIKYSIVDSLTWSYGLQIADMDKDDDLDVVASSPVAWYENGNLSWSPHTIDTERDSAGQIWIADIDNDEDLDVLATYYYPDKVVWYKAPTWETEVLDDKVAGAEGITAADMDGDGDLDVMVTAFDGDQVVFYENFRIKPGFINVPDAQPTIQAGIDAAVDGDMVLVAEGTYFENINFKGKAITVASHFIIDDDTSHISKTIIDGSQPSHPDSGSVVYFISDEDTNSVLYGFSITGGTGTIIQEFDIRSGGGIYMLLGGGRIAHNRIFRNSISYPVLGGVGVVSAQSSANQFAIIEFNDIYQNSGQSTAGNVIRQCIGGGIAAWTAGEIRIKNNNIYDNELRSGLVFSVGMDCGGYNNSTVEGKFLIEGNLVRNNTGYPSTEPLTAGYAAGAGIRIISTEAELVNNRILDNKFANNPQERSYGGGLSIWASATVNIFNNIITGNIANHGGGIELKANATLINNVIYANTADFTGGGIITREPGQIVLNTILWNNSAPTGPEIFVESGDITVAYSDVKGGWEGIGNIDADPLFVDTLEYHLSDSSLCIGSGVESIEINGNQYNSPIYDIEGNLRPNPPGSSPDIGAWESPRDFPSDVDDLATTRIPESFYLAQNYPNPFNPETEIPFQIPRASDVVLKIYNLLGQEIRTLADQQYQPGFHSVHWDGKDTKGHSVSSGIYLYRLEAGNFSEVRKMTLLR